jgi:hypothetical protein
MFAHLTVSKQEMFEQTFVSQPQNIEVVWREKSKQLLFEIPRFHILKVFKDLKSTFKYYSLLFKCLIGVFNYNIFTPVKFYKATSLASSIFWKVSSRSVCCLFG